MISHRAPAGAGIALTGTGTRACTRASTAVSCATSSASPSQVPPPPDLADSLRHHRHVAVVGMVEAHDDVAGAAAEGRDLGRSERKAQELHRRRLAILARAFLVLLRDPADRVGADPQEGPVLDAAQGRQHARTADRIVDLEHNGRHQFAALGDQRIVGRELVRNLSRATLFDEQHLVHLMQHRLVGFEIERRERADLEPAVPLDLGNLPTAFGAQLRILGGRQDGGGLDLARCHASRSINP